jgi:UDP:flavonoid glycosyltransferase YjiC (YdhE family)
LRILFTSAGKRGHSDPLVPMARGAQRAGHTVAFCCRPPMAPVIAADGFETFEAGPAIFTPSSVTPLVAIDTPHERTQIRTGFAGRGIAHERAISVRELATTWRPDVLVCDEMDFGALIAAERLDVPYATVVVVAAGSFVDNELVAEPLNDLRTRHGLPPDPDLAMLDRYLVFAPGPPRFRDPKFPLGPTAHAIRPAALEQNPTPIRAGTKPLVYFTLGSVFNMESGDLFARVLTGLRDLAVDVVATVGAELDPASLGPQPVSVRVERFIPLAAVLPAARAVVSHAGSATVLGTIAYGVPSVLIPMGTDQPANAARCEALGAARVLDVMSCTPSDLRDAVASVLHDPSYLLHAAQLRAETEPLLDSDACVALLERLAAERLPIVTTAAPP